MTTRAAIARRVALLFDIIRPRHSLAARVDKLDPELRALYDAHQHASSEWMARYKTTPGGAYAAMLDGNNPPPMPRQLRDALFESPSVIPIDATLEQAADIYRRAIEGGRR